MHLEEVTITAAQSTFRIWICGTSVPRRVLTVTARHRKSLPDISGRVSVPRHDSFRALRTVRSGGTLRRKVAPAVAMGRVLEQVLTVPDRVRVPSRPSRHLVRYLFDVFCRWLVRNHRRKVITINRRRHLTMLLTPPITCLDHHQHIAGNYGLLF